MSDAQERTEEATTKRMKEVRSKGKLQKSQDVTAWLGVGAAVIMIPAAIAAGADATTRALYSAGSIASSPDPEAALAALAEGLGSVIPILSGVLISVVIATIAGSAVQGGIHLKKFKGKFEQFNLVAGIKRTFGLQTLWQGAKTFLKTALVGLALYLVIQASLPVLMTAGGQSVRALLSEASGGVMALAQTAIAAGLVLAAVDVLVIMRRNRKQTRMTKKEVTDEHKNTDGDPLIKSQRRSRQLAMSRNRMIAAISDADVVLINPTHFALAIRYEPGKSAPRVVAKGAGVIATRIREEAFAKEVPMIKDIPLTRALHAACELGQEIPVEFYTAMAQILTFVMLLKRRGSAAGIHTISPTPPPRRNTP